MTERVKHICRRRALPQGNELCLRLNLCPVGWMLHLGKSFGTALVLRQCRLVWLSEKASGSFSPAGTENNRAMFYDILQGKHRWGQGQTTWEGSQAFVQSLWGVTHPSERSRGQQADCPVFWHHRNLSSLFCGSGPSPGKPKARLVTIFSWWLWANQASVHIKKGCTALWMAFISPLESGKHLLAVKG